MKKTVVRTDGTQEVLEGTPEEIAELERKIRQQPVNEDKGGNRRILNEEEIRKLVQEEVAKVAPDIQIIKYIKTQPAVEPWPAQPWRSPFWWEVQPTWRQSEIICTTDGNSSYSSNTVDVRS